MMLILVLYTYFVRFIFKFFSCGKANTDPGYITEKIEDEFLKLNGIEREQIGKAYSYQ